MRVNLLLLPALILLGCSHALALTDSTNTAVSLAPKVELPAATVISVGDGDTLRVSLQGSPTTIRLGCIDAPERSQPEGDASAARLRALLPRGASVTVRRISSDRYGRTVAELYLAGKSLNTQLVKEGMAVVYPSYLNSCPDSRQQLLSVEQSGDILLH